MRPCTGDQNLKAALQSLRLRAIKDMGTTEARESNLSFFLPFVAALEGGKLGIISTWTTAVWRRNAFGAPCGGFGP